MDNTQEYKKNLKRQMLQKEIKEIIARNTGIRLRIIKMTSEMNYNITLIEDYEKELKNL
ncbi:MAG: hypothetical protein Unbinned2716contig1001_41 [Prokaryotic dsDNA virus sp.]|nr:MAG: hypothetical protein Unbinned2716contig1001_41 [Prokaryotic dsDNA virus sp.]